MQFLNCLAKLTISNLKLALVACNIHGRNTYKFFVTKPVVKIQLGRYKWKHNMDVAQTVGRGIALLFHDLGTIRE
jgi:hypothetical protein